MSQLVLGLDVCVPLRVVARLRAAGVKCILAQQAEPDLHWFLRAQGAKAAAIVSNDKDLEIFCFDEKITFVRWRPQTDSISLLSQITQALANPP